MRTALAFFILFLVLGSVYFQSVNWQQWLTKTYRSPIELQKVVENQNWTTQFSAAGVGLLNNGQVILDSFKSLWLDLKNLVKSFWQALVDYIEAWPGRAKRNWLKFLGYQVDNGEQTVGTNGSAGGIYKDQVNSTDYNIGTNTSSSPQSNSERGKDLNLTVMPSGIFSTAELRARLNNTFSDPVEINISESNNEGIVVPQFREGPGRTYIFLLNGATATGVNQ